VSGRQSLGKQRREARKAEKAMAARRDRQRGLTGQWPESTGWAVPADLAWSPLRDREGRRNAELPAHQSRR
jgi:hypothetical protein